jgi:dihydroflavonol-4-reductase
MLGRGGGGKVFVTGATGLLGNNLVRLLVEQGYEVVGLVRSEEKAKHLLGDVKMTVVKGDMRDVPGFAQALDGCHTVFHTAAYFREYYGPGDHAPALEEINVKGTLALMDEADRLGVRRFVHTSSAGTVGMRPDGSPGDEDTPPSPEQLRNLYFKSKIDGDAKIRDRERKAKMAVVEILPGWMWGPRDAAPTAAGRMALDFLARKIPVIVSGGMCVVDARDVAAAMIAAMEKGKDGGKYIVAGEFYTIEELLRELERVSGVSAPKRRIPHAVVMTFAFIQEVVGRLTGREVLMTREGVRTVSACYRVSSAKARRELGVTFRPLEETFRDVVGWYNRGMQT